MRKNNTHKTVYLVDDDAMILRSISLFLHEHQYQVEAYSSLAEFKKNLPLKTMSVLVTDMQLLNESGLELQRFLLEENIEVPTLFLSGNSHAQEIIDALKNGAYDFLLKPVDPNTLLTQIEKAFTKADLQWQIQHEQNNWAGLFQSLTEKEKDVAQYIKQGYSNKVIAQIMQVKPDTIKKKRAQILQKMQCDSLPEFISRYP
ncbi:TtrR Response regulator [Methylophilaceae bacterium]|jgi:two-component system response regulator TtrR